MGEAVRCRRYRTLNAVAASDWRKFFTDRLESKSASIPLGGIEGAGYTFVYTGASNMFTDPWSLDGSVNAYGSIGIHVGADGTIDDAWPGRPAFTAGIGNGMKIVAVNGRRYSSDVFTRALQVSATSTAPMEFIIDNAGDFKTVRLDYHGGLRYPHLERTPGNADLLAAIATKRVR